MPRQALAALFGLTALGLLGLGVTMASWWPLAGGTCAAAAGIWLATEEA